jgi:integrase
MQKSTNILRINSVSTRSAKFNTLHQPDQLSVLAITRPVSQLDQFKSILGHHYYLFVLLESSGCRYSEVQSIEPSQISNSGQVLIKGKKGSKDRFISDTRATQFLLNAKQNSIAPFLHCHVNSSNRLLHKIGLITQKAGRKKLTVSGIFRELYAKSIREVSNDNSKVSEFLGHKSDSNSQFYGKG